MMVVTANVNALSLCGANRSTSSTVQAVTSTMISGMIGTKSANVMKSNVVIQFFSFAG